MSDRGYPTDPTDAGRIYFLPNLFTAGNLFCGFLAIIRCVQAKYGSMLGFSSVAVDYYTQGVWFIVLAAIFDLIDGRVARVSGRLSLFGAEFDSLADLVSFGVAPALLVFFLILSPSGRNYSQYIDSLFLKIGWFVGFVYLLCCAARLARFNVASNPLLPTSPSSPHDFVGLPVPAAAGVIVSIAVILIRVDISSNLAMLLLPTMLIVSFLMVSTIRFPSFKHLSWKAKTGFRSFLLFVIFCAMINFFSVYSIAAVFFSYLIIGLFRHLFLRRGQRDATAK